MLPAPRLAAAQVATSADSLPSPLQRLGVGETVLIRTSDGRRVQDKLAGVTYTPVALVLRNRADSIPVAIIDSVWLRRSKVFAGAVTGGLLLGVPAFLIWSALCEGLSDGAGCHEYPRVLLLSLPEAALGAGLGALFGSRHYRWTLRYVRG